MNTSVKDRYVALTRDAKARTEESQASKVRGPQEKAAFERLKSRAASDFKTMKAADAKR